MFSLTHIIVSATQRHWLLTCFLLLLLPASSFGQGTTAIRGIVLDEQRASMPGATVSVRHAASGLERFVVTEADGSFELANLPLGTHDLRISMEGFSSFQQ